MRLLAKNQRNPSEIAVNAQPKKDDDGEYGRSRLAMDGPDHSDR